MEPGVGLGSTPSLEGDGVTGGWCRYPSVSRPGKMETFGQVGCSVRRLPIHFMVGTGGTIIFVSRPGKMETFGQIACSTGADGDLRSGRVLGQETGTIIFVSVRAQPHDQKWNRRVGLGSTPSLEWDGETGGWCRYPSFSRRGRWGPSVRLHARLGQMETFGQVACSVRRLPIHFMVGTGGTIKKGERWRPSVRSRARRGRRHDHGGTGGTIRMRTNIFPTGGKLALIAGNKTEKKKGFTTFKWRIL